MESAEAVLRTWLSEESNAMERSFAQSTGIAANGSVLGGANGVAASLQLWQVCC
jgi:hypothetical protein